MLARLGRTPTFMRIGGNTEGYFLEWPDLTLPSRALLLGRTKTGTLRTLIENMVDAGLTIMGRSSVRMAVFTLK
jgi:hypothetical protein